MSGFSLMGMCALAFLALSGCGASSAPGSVTAKEAPPPDPLNRILERYWDEHLPLENAISPQYLADSLSIERRYLEEVSKLARDDLQADARLNYDIFKRQRELTIEGFTYPGEFLPINPFDGVTQRLVASAQDLARAKTAADYETWLRHMDEYVRWTKQAIVNMREGMRRGYTSSRSLVERMLPILERLGSDDPSNVFYAPARTLPDTINETERSRLAKDVSNATKRELLPAIRALHDFLQQEYLPRARAGIALSELPLGTRWYVYRIKLATSLNLAPDEIHRIGVADVERIGAQLQAIPSPPPTQPSAPAPPLNATELLNAYKDLAEKVRPALSNLFSESPKGDFEIRGSEWLREPAAPLSYQRAQSAEALPAVLYVDVGRGSVHRVVIANFLRQALPGRYFQTALQQERLDLPLFRRFGSDSAFNEGWGLYAASLGEALGVYPDDAAKSDALAQEMRCAAGAVVDTGLQAKGWMRGQALDYLRAHLVIDEPAAQALIDWYATNPADALSCMMGKREFLALRARAQQSLGGRFDIRGFHTEILQSGAMPLDILEARMKAWMDASK
jgi:uncharacterized protein (DUF885 family)